jgi:hypothetical protein
MLPGFIFPPDPPGSTCDFTPVDRRIRPNRSVCVAVGRTGAYAAVIDRIAHQVSSDPFDVTFLHDRGGEFGILGTRKSVRNGTRRIPNRAALLNSVALGITRGGVSATEIAARCTLVLGEEKGHWLSKEQRAYALRKGVGVPVATADLMADPVGTVTRLLGEQASAAARARGAAVPRDSLRTLAADIVALLGC